jgi:Flp pilus assembly protein TadG
MVGWMKHRQRGDHERGATLVEFALIAPLLLMLVFGIIEFGRWIAVVEGANTASREGARFGSTATGYDDCAGITAAAITLSGVANVRDDPTEISIRYYHLGDDPSDPTNAYTTCAASDFTDFVTTDFIEVEVTKAFQTGIPIISNVLGPRTVKSIDRRTIFEGELLDT